MVLLSLAADQLSAPTSAGLRQQLGLDGKAAARTTAERTNMT